MLCVLQLLLEHYSDISALYQFHLHQKINDTWIKSEESFIKRLIKRYRKKEGNSEGQCFGLPKMSFRFSVTSNENPNELLGQHNSIEHLKCG